MVREFSSRLRPNFSDILVTPTIPLDENETITVDVPGTRFQPGIEIFPDEVPGFDNDMYGEWLSFVAQIYKKQVKEAIEDQDFLSDWEPLSEDYKRWKEKAGLSTKIWKRTGQLQDAIRVRFFPQVDSYAVGIDGTKRFRKVETIKGPDGEIRGHRLGRRKDVKILFIARLMEFGGPNMPARPLFGPTRERISKNIRGYFEDYVSQENLETV